MFFYNFSESNSVKIYKSSIPIENKNKLIVGLKYLKSPSSDQKFIWKNGISACMRFNYEKLNNYVFYFGEAKKVSIYFHVKWLFYNSYVAQGGIGFIRENQRYANIPWFGYDYHNKSTLSVHNWQHLCISINPKANKIILIAVRIK